MILFPKNQGVLILCERADFETYCFYHSQIYYFSVQFSYLHSNTVHVPLCRNQFVIYCDTKLAVLLLPIRVFLLFDQHLAQLVSLSI
jgi:hypothetical protein